ncbi:MAG: isoprenyl transferase [Bacteroidota bacterium]|nr:isoprenyl transferase [Bacteroidota bacterium]
MELLDKIDKTNLPEHIAIIMDGNGRWAKQRGKLRVFGHQNGQKAVQRTIETCARLQIKHLTLYAFSTENWNRPKAEVEALMKLLVKAIKTEIARLHQNNIKFEVIGNINDLPKSVREPLDEAINKTKDNTGMLLSVALSYGSREELVRCVKVISEKVKNNLISVEDIDELVINQHLYTQNLPDVDLLIRTSGEHRISNFLLWQIAYSELYFTEVLWPDFEEKNLYEAIISYQKRERRFGKTSEQIK